MIGRRRLLSLLGARILSPCEPIAARAGAPLVTLLAAPLELAGAWGGSAPGDVTVVIERMREASLAGVHLLSDHQPKRLRIEDHSGGTPSIWLHSEEPETGWIIVIVNTQDWCNLAYQFGHELGHVLCNSWAPDAAPRPPCQWIEEALAEAFSLRGLGLLADEWARAPPFPHDASYASAIRSYRETILGNYRTIAQKQEVAAGFGAWFVQHRTTVEGKAGLDGARGAVSTMLAFLEGDKAMVADMGALNRWPGRSGVPLPEYLDLWTKSCAELHAPGRLPKRLRELLVGA